MCVLSAGRLSTQLWLKSPLCHLRAASLGVNELASHLSTFTGDAGTALPVLAGLAPRTPANTWEVLSLVSRAHAVWCTISYYPPALWP